MRIPEEGSCDALPHRPPPTMVYPAHSTAQRAQQSARVRALWETFERGLASAQRTTQHKTLAAHEDADRAYNALPPSSRPSPTQHAASKEAKAREMTRALYNRLVEDWHSRLAGAGLTAEMWTDITPEEMDRVAKALGAGEGATHDSPVHIKAPSLSINARNNNVSSASWHSTTSSASGASYAFVKPCDLNSEEEDDAYFSPHTPFSGSSAAHPYSEPASPALSFHSANASASENDADDDEDAPGTGRRDPFASWAQPAAESSGTSWNAHSRRTTLTAHPYTSASGSTSASASASMASLSAASRHSPHNTHPELSAHVKNNHEKFAFPSNGHGQRTASSSSASSSHSYSQEAPSHPASQSRSTSQLPARVPQPYIGPSLLTTDDEDGDPTSLNSANGHPGPLTGPDAEAAAADFDRFKLATRMRMIVEFHVAAAAAEIKLAGEIWRLRRGLPRKPDVSENGAGRATTTTGSKTGKTNGKGKESNGRNAPARKLDLSSKGKAKQTQSQKASLATNGDGNHSDASSDDAHSGDEQDDHSTPADLVVAHQSAMSTLQAAKEAERRSVVKEECDKRRAELLLSQSKNALGSGSPDGTNGTATGKDGKAGKKDERRKGRSGTLISGQPANIANSASNNSSNGEKAKEANEEPWLSAALRSEGSLNGREDDGALEKALGMTFDSGTILGSGGVEAFLDGIVPNRYKAVDVKDSAWSSEASQPNPWGVQNTPTAANFGSHPPPPPHRRRASTSASASAAAAAMAASSVASNTNTNGHGPRRVHAPVPVRAAPFGELSASSSDEEGNEAASRWGSSASGQNSYTQGNARNERGYTQPPSQHTPYIHPPPLKELERELDPELMAAFVQYSGLASKEGGSGAIMLGGMNTSNGSSGSSGSNLFAYSSSNSSGSSSNNGMFSASSNGHNSSMFSAQGGAGMNNPYNTAAAAFSGAEYEAGLGRGGGRNAYASAAQALMNSSGGLQMAPAANEQGWNTMHGSQGNTAVDGYGHAPAGRSRSRSPTMTHAFPSWAARMTGGSHGQPPMEQQQSQHYQQQSHALPQQPQVKDHPARGPTATPIASGWTRKFQKAVPANGTPQPQASSGSSMFGLRNPFGFSEDSEHNAPPPSSTSSGSSWLRKATGPTTPAPEPAVSIWEQVTQQKAKMGPASNAGSGSASGRKAMAAVPSPSPPLSVPVQAVDTSLSAMAGKKQLKKPRQVVVNKGGKAVVEAAADPEPELDVLPPGAWPSGSAKFATHSAVDDMYNENEPDYTEKGTFARPSKVRGGPPVTTIGRQRLNSISNSGGWDIEAGTASTPRPAAKIPAHLQGLAASMSTPPPFGLKPVMNGASQTQPTERPGTGMGMNGNTVRARGNSISSAWGAASNANGNGTTGTQSGGSTGRSLWGLFGGGSNNDVTSKSQAEGWGASSGANEEGDIELGDEGAGNGDDDWTPISRGSVQPEKVQAAPASLAQRLSRRGPEAVTSQAASEPSKTAAAAAAASKNANGANGKKVAKGKKVMIEEVPDDETESRGETLPVNSRHIFDEADSSTILGPKPSVPPATYDSIISYTDDESERKPAAAPSVAPSEDWMEVAAKELKDAAAKKKVAGAGGSGAWGSNASKPSPEPTPPAAPAPVEEVKASPPPPPEPVKTVNKPPTANNGKGKKKGKR